jgi:hypothetical protein
MTPKEKAKELVQKMRVHSPVWEIEGDAKQCALIAVEELIRNSFPGVIKCHWEEVKQEIEKL